MKRKGPKPGSKQKPVPVITEESNREFIKERARKLYNNPANTKLDFNEMEYFLSTLDILEKTLSPTISNDPIPHKTKAFRYTPRQMFDVIMNYFRITLRAGQPLTKMGISLFTGVNKDDMNYIASGKWDVPELKFIADLFDFVEMYIEYTAQKKTNPAFQIFWLKNRGWKDKLEIEASSTQGALTDEERQAARERMKKFSEGKIIEGK